LEIAQRKRSIFTLPHLHEVFAGFVMTLIGLELMSTIAMYIDEHVIHVEVPFGSP